MRRLDLDHHPVDKLECLEGEVLFHGNSVGPGIHRLGPCPRRWSAKLHVVRAHIEVDVALAGFILGHGETEPAVHGDLLPFLQVIEDASPRADDIIERGCPLVAALLVARQREGDELALGSLPGVGPHHGVRGDVADKEDVLHDGLFLMVGKYVWSVLVIGTQEGHSLDKGIVRGA